MDQMIQVMWEKQNYTAALEKLTESAYSQPPDPQAINLLRNITDLMDFVNRAQQALGQKNEEEAIEWLNEANRAQAKIREWPYQPLIFLQEKLGVDVAPFNDASNDERGIPAMELDTDSTDNPDSKVSAEESTLPQVDPSRRELLQNRLFEDSLLPTEEINAINQLIELGDQFDKENQSLPARKQIAEADLAFTDQR